MENDKYYTPEIEEFHVGFEYEYRGVLAGDWENITTEQEDFSIMFDDFEHEMDGKFNELYRVKKLDQEDIESLGWKYEKTHAGTSESFYTKDSDKHSIDWLGLDHDAETNYLRIYYSQCGGDNTRFSGTIKNKSELRRLMKQLGINI